MCLNKIFSNISYPVISLQSFVTRNRHSRPCYPTWDMGTKVKEVELSPWKEVWKLRLESCLTSKQAHRLGGWELGALAVQCWKRTDISSGLIHPSELKPAGPRDAEWSAWSLWPTHQHDGSGLSPSPSSGKTAWDFISRKQNWDQNQKSQETHKSHKILSLKLSCLAVGSKVISNGFMPVRGIALS